MYKGFKMKIIVSIIVAIGILFFSSCTKVLSALVNPTPCADDGSCVYKPNMDFIIEEQMCVDNGIDRKCTSYYQNTFAYTATASKGEGYSSYGFNTHGINKEGESITNYHSVCEQLIESGNPDTYLAIPSCHLEHGSHTTIPLVIGSYGDSREATVKETLTYYDNYNRPSQTVSAYVPIAKFLVGLDNGVFDQNAYGMSLEYLEKDRAKILAIQSECRSKKINKPTMPVNECSFNY